MFTCKVNRKKLLSKTTQLAVRLTFQTYLQYYRSLENSAITKWNFRNLPPKPLPRLLPSQALESFMRNAVRGVVHYAYQQWRFVKLRKKAWPYRA